MRLLFLLLVLVCFNANAQWKSYGLGVKGDTLNRIDQQNLKQGQWIVHLESMRGEPGYEEEGVFKDGKKEGLWRRYNLQGDIIAIENYRFGYKNGTSQYFNIAGILREESWRAVDPKNPYDTVDVYDIVNPDKITRKAIKLEGTSVKHGTWKYYTSGTGTINKTENWVYDQLQDPNKKPLSGDLKTIASAPVSDTATAKKPELKKPKEVMEFEKKNSGKKKIVVRDGRTGN
ncbi:MAG: hypothetical protein JWN76_3367 [Chitinophagaceae bacterium]|nr:hypothetical protein [Chitinophagaceae bacterium]